MTFVAPARSFNTPVLMVIFNRPETTRIVFEEIRKVRPPRLYVAADGPRPHVPSDKERSLKAKEIIHLVDWPCEVKTLFRTENLGCGRGVSSAVTWFFEHEEHGIILEDDCLPSQSFFWYCEDLLMRYRDDNRVMHIGGNNFQYGWKNEKNHSYYFSRSGHIWGWATWRRAWKLYDFDISLYEKIKELGFFNKFFLNRWEKMYRFRLFERTASNRGKVTYWAYQWDFCRYVHSGLSTIPAVNLVRNIGFGLDSTHTKNTKSMDANLPLYDLEFPMEHPPYIIRDLRSDSRYFSHLIKERITSRLKAIVHL